MPDASKRQQRTQTVAKLNLGRLRLERRNAGKYIYARAYLQGKLVTKSTGEETLGAASKVAQDWYLEQLDRIRKAGGGRKPTEKKLPKSSPKSKT